MKAPALGAMLLGATATLAAPALGAQARSDAPAWIGVWGASASGVAGIERFQNETVRQTVHLDGGGSTLRLRLSNALSEGQLVLGSVRIARPGSAPGVIQPESDTPVTFGGQPSVTVPEHAIVLSDPVKLRGSSATDVVVSLLIAASHAPTVHDVGPDVAYVAPGDQTRATAFREATTRTTRLVLSGVDAEAASPDAGTIVALGDSITDGFRSTPGLDRRWPDVLARRLAAAPRLAQLGVVNAGISGNRLLHDGAGPSALSRLPRDVFTLPGLRTICVLEGINDIAFGAKNASQRVTAADLIAGYDQIIAQGHEHGAKVLIGTLTPFSGSGPAEQVRQQVNAWIRLKDGFEGVLDFDAALRDPSRPSQMLARFDSGDHLHPNDDGYAAMAGAIDLDLLR